MKHIALYRTWRPQTFAEIVGQQHITTTLQNALKEQRFTHAYLFSGPRGTGKTSAAKLFAKTVNCREQPAAEPCNECEACKHIQSGAVMDVLEIDAASNRGVEEIRDLRENVKYAPTEVSYKVYIIDEVHMLTTEAFNALLKTLEEPPSHVIFILATTEPHRIPATIISRCQRFDFRRVSIQEQMRRIEWICQQEDIDIQPEAVQYIARLSEGGMRDALSLLDQIISFSGKHVTYEQVVDVTGGMASEQFSKLAKAVREKDIGQVLDWLDQLLSEGKSAEKCMEHLIQYYRDLLVIKKVGHQRDVQVEDMTDRVIDLEHFKAIADEYEDHAIFSLIDVLNRYHAEMKYASQPKTVFEVALMKLCTPADPAAGAPAAAASPSLAVASSSAGKAAVHAAAAADSSVAAMSVGGADAVTLQQLMERIAQLEEQVKQLQNTGVAARPTAAGSTASAMPRGGAEKSPRAQKELGRASAASSGPSGISRNIAGTAVGASPKQLEVYLAGGESEAFRQLCLKWSDVLQKVKDTKIMVHAWLVDAEPAAALENRILLAFKNMIHRETTEKPSNRELIEKAMEQVFGKSMKFETVMQKQWKELRASRPSAGTDAPGEAATKEAAPSSGASTDIAPGKASSIASEEPSGEPADKASDEPTVNAPNRAPNHAAPSNASDHAPPHAQDYAPSQAPHQAPNQAPDQTPDEAQNAASGHAAEDDFKLEYEDVNGQADPAQGKEWIKQAIDLFGQELVTIQNESSKDIKN